MNLDELDSSDIDYIKSALAGMNDSNYYSSPQVSKRLQNADLFGPVHFQDTPQIPKHLRSSIIASSLESMKLGMRRAV